MIDFKSLQIIAYQFINKQGVTLKHYPWKGENGRSVPSGLFFTDRDLWMILIVAIPLAAIISGSENATLRLTLHILMDDYDYLSGVFAHRNR